MDTLERRQRIADALRKAGIAQENEESSPAVTPNAQTVLERRYLIKNPDGTPLESPRDMFRRVACNLSQADLNYGATEKDRQTTQDEFLGVMVRKDFIPNSPTLMNAGRELQQLSACFVLPVEDSLDGIFSAVKKTALIHKSGGGTGFSFNNLRPSGDFVQSTGGIASGPASFIQAFDTATHVVKQGGTRRGANMGILNVDHPDVLEFIRMKGQEGMLENFNISIAVTEEFMEQVRNGADCQLVNPRTGEPAGTLPAREVFNDVNTYIRSLGIDTFRTLDKLGRNATLLRGQLGAVEGIPVIVSEQMSLADADGKVTDGGNTAKTGRLLMVNRSQWRVGFRRELLIETTRDIQKRQNIMVVSMRLAFMERTGSRATAKHTALQYNITGVA